MKKILLYSMSILSILLFVPGAFAQELIIIHTQGDVLVRSQEILPWRRAVIGESLYKNYELLTKTGAQCTLSLDKDLSDVVVVEESSHIKIADILGRNIELSKGRVFSLINTEKTAETFEIKTPTALAGARGTGWVVDFSTSTTAKCFQGVIYVIGLDEDGNKISQQNIKGGSGIEVFTGGTFGDLFDLSYEDRDAWKDFSDDLKDLKDLENKKESFDSDNKDTRNEQADDFGEEQRRILRQDMETPRDN